ncbi:MAG: S8 family serine peptidase [Ilumatobacter sp.]|nr:S8 family serine peptidase [Ilumatobacter sp.]
MTSTGAQAEKPPVPPGQAKKVSNPMPVEESTSGSYIVVLKSNPLVAEFGQDGLGSSAANARANDLVAEQDQLMAEAGVPASAKLSSYDTAMNGFAAIMSYDQALTLSGKAGVAAVFPNELQQPTTDASGDFLGLSGDTGVWAEQATGDGVLVGIIDSGIWPEHPSLAPAGFEGSAPYELLGDYVDPGTGDVYPGCEFGDDDHTLADGFADPDFACNAKLIGARQVLPAYEALTGLTDVEYDSARDEDGHGTHTATTAAGNADVPATVLGQPRGIVTGIAPDAQIVAYKALGTLGGYGSDLALAIDIAVEDKVDVINYSIGSSSFAIGPDDIAFFFATLAGVHVATSNGNSGPGAATIGSPASVPWLTSVGASTHDRTFLSTVTAYSDRTSSKNKPNEITISGVSITGGTDVLPLVDAADFGNELCDPSVPFVGQKQYKKDTIEGKIVLCKRGVTARIDKSLAVYEAGGAGMVLYNTFDADTQITDSHWVPSVHVNFTDGSALKYFISKAKKPTAQIAGGEKAATQGSVMAAFSSRGPNLLSGDLIKPDVTAPGVNILAGNTPTPTSGPAGNLFQSISGTSMSSPHVAGLMALMSESHPDWNPSMVKSSLMTTARQDVTKEDGVTPADPFDMGAGHVQPTVMFDPGLVYDVGNFAGEGGFFEYVGVACAVGVDLYGICDPLDSLGMADGTQYNQASIASAALPGSQTVTRTVTNVSGTDLSMTPVFAGLTGITASTSPAVIDVPNGATVSFDINFTVTSAPLNKYTFGSMTLQGGGYSVYSPIALQPVTLGVPYEVSGTIDGGGTTFGVEQGYTGDYAVQGHGLLPSTMIDGTVGDDPDQSFSPSDEGNGATAHSFTIEPGVAFARILIPPVDEADTVDLDLYVYDPSGAFYDYSGNAGTYEVVDIVSPEAGDWTFFVHGYDTITGTASYSAHTWQVSETPGGNLVAAADGEAVLGATGLVELTWPSDLASGLYLGAVSHLANGVLDGLTIVSVEG